MCKVIPEEQVVPDASTPPEPEPRGPYLLLLQGHLPSGKS